MTKSQQAPASEVTAAALCDHSRVIVVQDHGAPISDEKWAKVRPGCIADFEKKREAWGDGVYRTFLRCGLQASDMSTMMKCNERAKHHAGLPKAALPDGEGEIGASPNASGSAPPPR